YSINYYIFFFFFSSRRRHTRSYGDWSSDVCSSDLRMPFDSEGHIAREIVGKISGSGRRLHSGEICETLQNIFKELPLALRLEVLEVAEPDGSCEQIMRIKTHARLDLFEETFDKQPRAN